MQNSVRVGDYGCISFGRLEWFQLHYCDAAASKAAIRHSQKLLGRTSAIGAFMIRLLPICFRQPPAVFSRSYLERFDGSLLQHFWYPVDLVLTCRLAPGIGRQWSPGVRTKRSQNGGQDW